MKDLSNMGREAFKVFLEAKKDHMFQMSSAKNCPVGMFVHMHYGHDNGLYWSRSDNGDRVVRSHNTGEMLPKFWTEFIVSLGAGALTGEVVLRRFNEFTAA